MKHWSQICLLSALLLAPVQGRINAQMTEQLICASSFRTGRYRHVTAKMKRAICQRDHATPCDGKHFEIDHLIPIEIGGSNLPDNLWAEPIEQARIKDKLENRLRRDVCAGKLTLIEAQQCIAKDWVACAKQW